MAKDPIFAAIAKLKKLMAVNDALAKEEIGGTSLEARLSQRHLDASGHRWVKQLKVVVSTTPTSLAGAAAFADFIVSFSEDWGGGDGEVIHHAEMISAMRSIRRFASKATVRANG